MNLLKRTYKKLYYYFSNKLLNQKIIELPAELRSQKNLFIYLDYEREFGGHKINNDNILEILNALDKYSIKATWFTVGKIFEKYPDSINEILLRGNEIGSHTYSHIPPFHTSLKELKNDFQSFSEVSKNIIKIDGFHAPNGKWSFSEVKMLRTYQYKYDIVSVNKNRAPSVNMINYFKNYPIIRFNTLGDDWALFNNNFNEVKVLHHFKELFNCLQVGQIGGIGVHPWVLFSNKNIYKGFFDFLNFIKETNNTNVLTLQEYYNQISVNLGN